MGRYTYTPESNEELEPYERSEDISEYTADDRNDDAKMLEDEKGLDTKTYLK
jgi:hypothetical protein